MVLIVEALDYAGDQGAAVGGRRRHLAGQIEPRPRRPTTSCFAAIFRAIPTRCSSCPPATRATTTTTAGRTRCSTVDPHVPDRRRSEPDLRRRDVRTTNDDVAPATSARTRRHLRARRRRSGRRCAVPPSMPTAAGGTSAAAGSSPAVAALVLAPCDPDRDHGVAVKDALMRSVGDTRTPGLIPLSVSGGRANAARAVRGAPSTQPQRSRRDLGVVRRRPRRPRALRPVPVRYARTPDGCPDADADGVLDNLDNCTTTPNLARPTTTATAIGNAVRSHARAATTPTATARPNLDDQCPTVYGIRARRLPGRHRLSPQPTAPPGPPRRRPDADPAPSPASVVKVSVKVTPKTCPRARKTCAKAAKVTVRLTRSATVSLRFEQRVKRGRRMVWKRYSTRSMTATTSARSYTLKRLKAGSYRVVATVARQGQDEELHRQVSEPGARSPRHRPRGFRHHEGGQV